MVKVIIINPGFGDGANEYSFSKMFGNSMARVEGETSVRSTVSSVIGGSYGVGYEVVDKG